MEKGVQLRLGEGPLRDPMSQHRRYHRSHVTHAGSYLRYALSFRFVSFFEEEKNFKCFFRLLLSHCYREECGSTILEWRSGFSTWRYQFSYD